jgi:recombination protein RecA
MTALNVSRKEGILNPAFVGRGLEGFQSRAAVELQSTGIAELDAVLGGGFPRGSLVELCGPASSGRTSLAFSLLAEATERQEACAFVDITDSLDPMSLASAGIDLARLLWIRCGESGDQSDVKTSAYFTPAQKAGATSHASGSTTKKPTQAGGWRHPRELLRGIENDIPSVVGKGRAVASGEGMLVARCAGEQVERDRELPRRGVRSPRPLPSVPGSDATSRSSRETKRSKPWKRLEQSLKVTDQLLHAGGWGVIVFDLGGISWVDARRINLSMWFRFRRALENTPTILLLLGEESSAKSCASLVLRCQRKSNHWSRASQRNAYGASTFEGFEVEGEVTRSRVLSQPADLARWHTQVP